MLDRTLEAIDGYLAQTDWQVKEIARVCRPFYVKETGSLWQWLRDRWR